MVVVVCTTLVVAGVAASTERHTGSAVGCARGTAALGSTGMVETDAKPERKNCCWQAAKRSTASEMVERPVDSRFVNSLQTNTQYTCR